MVVKRVKVKKPESYTRRDYRTLVNAGGLFSCAVRIKDTDLQILADRDVSDQAESYALQYRLQVEQYIVRHPGFVQALSPWPFDELAPPVVKEMLVAGEKALVGPMAAVAGVIAEYVGKALLKEGCREIVVENGGDIFLCRRHETTVAIFAGTSPLSLRVGLRIDAEDMPVAVCTSSGTIGHSLSFGEADSVTVVAASTALADAVATRLGNEVGRRTNDGRAIERALQLGIGIEGIAGIVIICGDQIGAVGNVELVKLS